jgi:hypothetical protein
MWGKRLTPYLFLLSFIIFVWSCICWFSGPFDKPFLNLPIFECDPLLPFAASAVLLGVSFVFLLLADGKPFADFFKRISLKRLINILLLILIIAVAFLFQLPEVLLYKGSNDNDSSNNGVAGYHIADGLSRPMFMYMKHYNGSLIPHLTAPLHIAFGKSALYQRLIATLFFLGSVILLFYLVRRVYDIQTAFFAAVIAAFPPLNLYVHLRYMEVPGQLFWGVLSFLLLILILERDKPSPFLFFWYGVVVGIGCWAQLAFVYYAAAGLLALFIRDKLFFVKPGFFCYPVGFILGGICTFIDSYFNDWVIFSVFFGQATDLGDRAVRFLSGIMEFFKHIPEQFGLPDTQVISVNVGFPFLFHIAAAIFIVFFIVYMYYHRAELLKIVKFSNVNPKGLIFLILVFSMFFIFSVSEQSSPPSPFRYTVALWTAVPVIIAVGTMFLYRKSKLLGILAAVFFVAVAIWSNLEEIRVIAEREDIFEEWEDFCEEQGINRFYGSYWRTYWTAFATGERIIGSNAYHLHLMPYVPYHEMVERSPGTPAFLFGDKYGESELQRRQEALLQVLNIDYKKEELSFGTLYYDFSERLTPKQIIDLDEKVFSARISEWRVKRVTGVEGLSELYLLDISVENTGETIWHADGRNGFIELVVLDEEGRELRRQPLIEDVVPGAGSRWQAILAPEEAAGKKVDLLIKVNDLLINEGKKSLEVGFESGGVPGEMPIVEFAAGTDSLRSTLWFISGWGGVKSDGGRVIRLSGAPASEVIFVMPKQKPASLFLRVAPAESIAEEYGHQDISIFCNGSALIGPVSIAEATNFKTLIPEELIRPGLNRLRFEYGHVEPEYEPSRNVSVFRFRPKAIGLTRLEIRPY